MQPPQNPPDFPSPHQPPLPPIAPPPPYGSPPGNPGGQAPLIAPPRGRVVSFDSISDAWNLFRVDMGAWIGASALMLVPLTVLSFVMMFMLPDSTTGQQFNLLFWPFSLLFLLVSTFAHGGLFRMALGQIRTGKANFGDMFNVAAVSPQLFLVTFLQALAVIGGMCLCFLPGLLMLGLFMFATPLVVDREKKMGVMEALSTSFNVLKPQMWMAMIFTLVTYLLANAGQALCGVGMVVTFPLYYLANAVVYRDYFIGDAMPPVAPSPWQAPPIADPRG